MWFAYWLLPYPNQRFLWPNFKSPLVWDVFAISTYLTISVVFLIVGLVPDVAALRDQATGLKRKIYAVISLGWEGSDSQWRHYRRGYGLFAALSTPLVLSVHSVVSFDFAMALVPGWHSTLFAPFFVDGAIFSGFAMVLILMLPMRYLFNWYAYIGDKHLDAMARLILVTSLVLTYFYACEVFTAWYSGDHFERASVFAKATREYAWAYWLMYFCNSVTPLVFFSKRRGPTRSRCTSSPSSCSWACGSSGSTSSCPASATTSTRIRGHLLPDGDGHHHHRRILRLLLHPLPRLIRVLRLCPS